MTIKTTITYKSTFCNKLKINLKLEKFFNGAMVYVMEDSYADKTKYYKICKTNNMVKQICIYNTHSIHNEKVVCYENALKELYRKINLSVYQWFNKTTIYFY